MDINKPEITNKVWDAYKCPNCGELFLKAPRCPHCGQAVIITITPEEMKRNLRDRARLVKAMETVCRNINDEEVFEHWLIMGVADGDIDSGTEDEDIIDAYCRDEGQFAELMDCFLECMKMAFKSGGLFCGDVVSNRGDTLEEGE